MDPARREALVRRYRSTLPAKRSSFVELMERVSAGEHGSLDELRIAAHKLAGSAAAYGIPELSELARAVEHASPGSDLSRELTRLIGELDRLISRDD